MQTLCSVAFLGAYKQDEFFTGKTWGEKKEKGEYPAWNEVNMWTLKTSIPNLE